MNGRLGRSRDSEDPVLEPQDMPESSGGTGGGGAGINGGSAGGSGGGAGGSGSSNGGGGGGGRDSCPTAIKLFAARYFKFLCGAGVLLGTVSFILSIIAIATDQWLQAELIYEVPNENVNDTQGENSTIIRGERISTGIWNICFQNFEDGVISKYPKLEDFTVSFHLYFFYHFTLILFRLHPYSAFIYSKLWNPSSKEFFDHNFGVDSNFFYEWFQLQKKCSLKNTAFHFSACSKRIGEYNIFGLQLIIFQRH